MQKRYTSDNRYASEDAYYSGETRQRGAYSDGDLRNPAGEYRSQRYSSQYSGSSRRPAGYNSGSGYSSAGYRSGSTARSSAYGGSRASASQQGYGRSGYARGSDSRYDERYDSRSSRYSDSYAQQSGSRYSDSYGYRTNARSASSRGGYARRTQGEDVRYGTGRAADSRYTVRRTQESAPRRESSRSAQGGYGSRAQTEYRRTQSAPKQITKRPEPRKDTYLPEAVRERNAELRKKRIIAGVIAGILLIAVIVIISVLAGGGNDDRSKPGVSKESPAPSVEPSATVAINAAANAASVVATATPTVSPSTAPTTAPDTIGNTNVNMTGVLGSSGSGAVTGGASAGLRSATFRIAGDVMVTEEQLEWAKSITGEYDFTENFTLITDSLANADYTMVNIETTLGKYKGKAYSGYPCFNSPPELLWPLVNSGVDYANLANNHMLDRYFDGMKNTIACVEYVGMDHSGAYPTQEARNTPKIIEVNGIKIGVVSYTHTTNGQEKVCSDDATKFGVPYLYKADLEGDIQACRNAGAELVMAVVHWGEEYTHEPDDNQLKYAKKLAQYGADIIIGNHSHNIQPMGYLDTVVNGVPKKVFTIFSIGNFLTSHTTKDSYYSIILEFTINEQANGSFTVDNVGYVPTYCWIENNKVVIVPSGKYYNSKPAGMSDSEWQRMRTTVQATQQMYSEFTMLEA